MKSLLSVVLLIASMMSCGIESQVVGYTSPANIVGFGNTTKRAGTFINPFQRIGGGDFPLSKIIDGEIKPGVEVAFYDGNDWVKAVSDKADDGRVHWFLKDKDICIDDVTVPRGVAIQYRLPETMQGLSFAGEVPESELLPSSHPIEEIDIELIKALDRAVFKGELLRPKPPPKIVEREVLVTNVVNVTNVVVKTNFVKQIVTETRNKHKRFKILFGNGEVERAYFSEAIYDICDPVTGARINIENRGEVRFVRDNSMDVSDDDRMDVGQMNDLYRFKFKKDNPKSFANLDSSEADRIVDKGVKEFSGEFYDKADKVGSILRKICYGLLIIGICWLLKRVGKWLIRMCGYPVEGKKKGKK